MSAILADSRHRVNRVQVHLKTLRRELEEINLLPRRHVINANTNATHSNCRLGCLAKRPYKVIQGDSHD